MVQAIVSDVLQSPGIVGRAGCHSDTQIYCSVLTKDAGRCAPDGIGMTEAAWAQVCELAGLPFIPKLALTIAP